MSGSSRGAEIEKPAQIHLMRRAGLVVARVLAATVAEVRTGATTAELDAVAAHVTRAAGVSDCSAASDPLPLGVA